MTTQLFPKLVFHQFIAGVYGKVGWNFKIRLSFARLWIEIDGQSIHEGAAKVGDFFRGVDFGGEHPLPSVLGPARPFHLVKIIAPKPKKCT